MGFNVVIERDIKNWSIVKVYKCSNCNSELFRTLSIRNGEFFEIDWCNISPICPCGEELLRPITTFVPIIDKIESVEI